MNIKMRALHPQMRLKEPIWKTIRTYGIIYYRFYCEPSMISSKTAEDASSEFALGEAVFYQNETCLGGGVIEDALLMVKV